jgi:hypothetical protein
MASVPEQITRVQVVANTGGQVVFTYPFLILNEESIEVYKEDVLLTLTTDYTVTGVGSESGGTIVLNVGVPVNTVLTLNRQTPIERTTDFTTGGEFTGDAINLELDRLTMICQEIETELERRGLVYPVTTQLETDLRENTLPQLTPNSGGDISIWSRAGGGGLVALTLASADDVNTLRSELASQTNGGDGALLVGYYDSSDSLGKTVHAKLDEIATLQADYSNNSTHDDCGAKLIGYNAQGSGTNVRDELDLLNTTRALPLTASLNGSAYTSTVPGTIANITSYSENTLYKIKFGSANPGAVTLNINGIGAKAIKEADGSPLTANFFNANDSVLLYYSASADEFKVMSPTLASATTTSAQARAWVYFTQSGTTVTVRKQYNVSSVQRISTGKYRVNFANTLDSAYYAVLVSGDYPIGGGASLISTVRGPRTTTSVEFDTLEFTSATWSNKDVSGCSVAIFGVLA